jgi:DNA-binding beta-propeller fold protein YncE
MTALRPFYLLVSFVVIVGLACSAGGPLAPSQSGSGASALSGAGPVAGQELAVGGEGTGPSLFSDGRGLAVNTATGAMAVADYQDGRIREFDPTGTVVTQWSVPNADKHTIITNMAGDAQGDVFVVTGGAILKYDASQKLKATWSPSNSGINSVADESNGNIVAAADDETFYVLSPAGKVLSSIKNSFSGNGGDTELNIYVATDAAVDIYALGKFKNAVFEFPPKGKFVKQFGGEGDAPGKLSAPGSIAVDSQGRVYVGDFKGIQVFAGDGTYQSLIPIKGVGAVRFIALDAQDNLYVTTGDNKVLKLSVPKS